MHIIDILLRSFWALCTYVTIAFSGMIVIMMTEDPGWRKDSYVVTWFCLLSLAGLLSVFGMCFT